jgi:hypothetical protein
MRNGASDYLLKNNLARLAPAVEHAIAANDAPACPLAADRELAARASACRNWPSTCRPASKPSARHRPRDPRRRGRLADGLKFDLDWIRRHAADPGAAARRIGAGDRDRHAIEASQRIMHNLRPAILEQGLVAALQWMASRFEKRTGVECLNSAPATSPDPNCRRRAAGGLPHGAGSADQRQQARQATRVVDLSHGGGVLSLEVSDNGRGLSRGDLAKARSFGIRGLHERASTVGGWVDLSSNAAGTTLILSVPLDGPEPALPDRPTTWR